MTDEQQYLFPDGAVVGMDNVVLHAEANRFSVKDVEGPLSIKSVVRGRVSWVVNGRSLTIDPGTFLVLGAGEKYSMDIDEEEPVETCCMFFRSGFVQQVAADMTGPIADALEGPLRRGQSVNFACRIFDGHTSPLLARLRSLARRCVPQLQPSGFEEDFLLLSAKLLSLHEETVRRMSRLPAARPATRRELFRRVEVAREYLHTSTQRSCSLEDAARVACVSPYHLHRAFTQIHECTPHNYLTQLRLRRAYSLLLEGSGVGEVCAQLGWASRSSFSRLFVRHFGHPPSSVGRLARSDTSGSAAID